MARYPGAVWLPIERNHGGRRTRTRAVVLHVDAGAAKSLRGWFNNPAALASSHFYVTFDGRVEQYLDTDAVAWTQRDGNSSCVGIETQGKGDGEWTPAQLAALAPLLVWLCDLYGLPRADMGNSLPSSRGIGLHRYGIDPWRARGCETWGPRGKACPGEQRVAQLPALIRAIQPAPAPTITPTQEDDPMIIYRAAGERTKYGVLAHNGGFVELQSKAEYDNLRKAGAREVWVEKYTLKNLIADARSH
ncbi:hypothetical protein DBB34_05375 [Sphaerisporangium cinnabarinum]|nr:N-acetylmuramoyl-L-alanine amidase [Sphaerisporangium cinnabarinum]PTU57178.1 hypothetical protein DBB34_05375 [Sphaerisporangium cinnabarinum]